MSRSAGMVDGADSKSAEGNLMGVRVPPSAPYTNKTNLEDNSGFVLFFDKDWFGIEI